MYKHFNNQGAELIKEGVKDKSGWLKVIMGIGEGTEKVLSLK